MPALEPHLELLVADAPDRGDQQWRPSLQELVLWYRRGLAL